MNNALNQILDSVTPDEVIDGKRVMLPRPGTVITGTIESIKHPREAGKESLVEATVLGAEEKIILPGIFGAWHSPGSQFQARSVYTEDLGSGWALVSSKSEAREISAAEIVQSYDELIKRGEEERSVLRDGLVAFGTKFVPDEPYGTKILLPIQLTKEGAIEQAQKEVGGPRYTSLRAQVEELDKKDIELEKHLNELKQTLGTTAPKDRLIGRSFVIRRQISQETKLANQTREELRRVSQEYNVLVDELRTPEKKAEISKRVQELQHQNQREFDKVMRIKSAYRYTSLSLIDARETRSEFELLGEQKIRVIGQERAIPADRKSFEQSLQKAQELRRAISRDIGN